VATDRNIGYTVAVSDKWIQVNATQATTPTPLSISVNPSGLDPGVYQGSVTVTAQDGNALKVVINLYVFASP
jgi:hypothetical protein